MNFDGKQFGRCGRAGHLQETSSERSVGPVRPVHIALLLGGLGLFLAAGFIFLWALPETAKLNRDEARAEQGVVAIVNQPVTHLPRTTEAEVFSPGWFHPGAQTPDFASVDIRKSQEFPY